MKTLAHPDSSAFPAAAVEFLDDELPKMEKAVSERDREFFARGTERVRKFLETWGLDSPQPVALERFPMCTEAVTDYLIVGLCRMSPLGSLCEPATFIPKFDRHLQECRALSK